MPRRARRRARRKPRRRRKPRTRAGTISVPRNQIAVADRYFCRLNYTDIRNVVGSTTSTFSYVANSLFDPENPLGGGQPAGFDQLMTLYGAYRVHACSIQLQVAPDPTSSTPGAPYMVTLRPANSPTYVGRIPESEASYSKWRISSGADTKSMKLFSKMATKKIRGLKTIMGSDDFTGSSASSPVAQWYFNYGVSSLDGVTNMSYSAVARLTFFCEFFDRANLIDVT